MEEIAIRKGRRSFRVVPIFMVMWFSAFGSPGNGILSEFPVRQFYPGKYSRPLQNFLSALVKGFGN
jgi:hypothetical protein